MLHSGTHFFQNDNKLNESNSRHRVVWLIPHAASVFTASYSENGRGGGSRFPPEVIEAILAKPRVQKSWDLGRQGD